MDHRLSKLITEYQQAVAEAVTMLEAAGLARPSSNMAWATSDIPWRGVLANGHTYYKHGYGCAVTGPNWTVDFDFGEHGQIDGVDSGRLRQFALNRASTQPGLSADELTRAFDDAIAAGELMFSGYILYYLRDRQGSEHTNAS
jgi:hypothetical protein